MGESSDATRSTMERSAKAVISQIQADGITPLLKGHGFARRGRRTYDRTRAGRLELINVEPHEWNDRYSGSFTINLGLFIPEVDALASLYPRQEPPQEDDCHVRCRIGDLHDDLATDDRRGWWTFDAHTDLPALGAEVRESVERHGLGFFERTSTRAGLLAWLRRFPPRSGGVFLKQVVLAWYAGGRVLAQEALDAVVDPANLPNRTRWDAVRIAGKLGLDFPAPTDVPALTVILRLAAHTPPPERYNAFHHLDHKFGEYVKLWRTVLPVEDPTRLYHTVQCTDLSCAVTFYGADPEELLGRLQRAFACLPKHFPGITWRVQTHSQDQSG